jgi:hypothetical protein
LPFLRGFAPMRVMLVPSTIRRGSQLACAWLLTACPPWPAWEDCQDADCGSTSSWGGVGEPSTPTSSGEFQSVTGGEESSVGDPQPATSSTTTGEPVKPVIVEFALTPEPIQFNGSIAATVSAEHADGVRMALDTGDVVELEMVEPGVFGGEIPVFTGLDNGEHVALLTPWRDFVEGVEVEAHYVVDLPLPGSQVFWEVDDALGPGQVEALGVLPDGDVVEFGTHYPQGAPRCYLRRRDKQGKALPDALAAVLPGIDCGAIDLQVDEHGAMFVLVHRPGADGLRWWLARIPAWGLGASNLGAGAKGETAAALAHHGSGTVAVCGSAPTLSTDVDAMVQLFRPNLPGEPWRLDYQPDDEDEPHSFDERARDCVFVGDSLALVGEAYGKYGIENVDRDRLFILRLGVAAKSSAWLVAPPGARTQSGAQAVAVDDQGRLVVAGYTCDDDCQPEGDLRIYDPGDALVWQASLGAFKSEGLGTQDLAWSPAGYAVVATGGLKGDESAFTVRAFASSQPLPLWTFEHKHLQALQLALALALGRDGEVYAGGLGASSSPAVLFIGG